MSKEWFSAAELAGMPGLPATKSGVIRKAKAGDWLSQPRSGRGGGWEYHLGSLPQATRDYLLRQATAKVAARLADENLLPTPAEERLQVAELTDDQRAVMQARLTVCAVIDELSARHGVSRREAIFTFLAEAKAGQLPAGMVATLRRANAANGGKRLATASTVYRWFQRRDHQGSVAVAKKRRPRSAPPAWLPQLLALYQRPQKPTVAACVKDWEKHFPEVNPPHVRTAQRHIEALPVEVREWGRMGRNARRSVQPFVRRTTDGLWPMDVVTVDGHLFKAYVRHPMTGRKFRPEVTTYLDVATRRAIGFSAWLAESQFAIWGALREMVLDPACGIPALHYSDNGAYRGEEHRSTLARIGTIPMFSQAYRAQARGIIERLNSSVWVPLARTLPTYVGMDMDKEAVKRSLKRADDDGANLMGWEDFIAECRRALNKYNDRPHGSLGKRSPNEAWQQAIDDGWKPTALDGDDLHDLLPTYERRAIRGEVKLPWGRYFHRELSLWHGRTVRVGVHPTDGSQVWVSDERGSLICIAERDGNAKPYVSESQLEHARANREKGRIRRLENKLEQVREENAGLVDHHTTRSLDIDSADVLEHELHEAVRISNAQRKAQAEADQIAVAELEAEMARERQGAAVELGDTPERRYARAYRLERHLENGELLNDGDRRWLERYTMTPEYQAQREFHEDFGLTPEWRGAK